MAGSIAQSTSFNSRTSPAAFTNLTQFTGATALLPGTTYELIASLYFSGTAPVDGTDSDNANLVIDGTSSAALPIPAVAGYVATWKVVITTGTGGVVQMQNLRTATTGTIYHASIIANPLIPSIVTPAGQSESQAVL